MPITFIIINDADIAVEVLNKRGAIYADRPTSVMVEMANYHHTIAAERYGPRWDLEWMLKTGINIYDKLDCATIARC